MDIDESITHDFSFASSFALLLFFVVDVTVRKDIVVRIVNIWMNRV